MQSEVAVEVGVTGAPTWALPRCEPRDAKADWRVVDQALRAIYKTRSGLDAEEARWLREAEAVQIWKPFGMVSALDYMERQLGYAPRTAQDKLRVARALGALPRMTEALGQGELGFSAVRELTRVATAATDAAWVTAALGKNVRQIEELVADHHPGDHPDDPKDPAARTHVVRLELSAETFAMLRQARQILDDEHGSSLSEDQLVATLCGAVLDDATAGAPAGRAKFQVAVTVCERCSQGWQHGAGAKIPISDAAVDRALCDAQHLGSIDGAGPERAYQDVSPSVARFVWHRDGGRCRAPGCRSARGIEIHHLVHRADGGGHDASNLVLLCSACHQAHHAGTLIITGTAERIEVVRPAQASAAKAGAHVGAPEADDASTSETTDVDASQAGAHVGAPETTAVGASKAGAHVGAPEATDVVADAKAALTQMGWKPAIAQAAVDAAADAMATGTPLELLLVEALQRCAQSRGATQVVRRSS